MLGAQALYLGEPLLSSFVEKGSLRGLAASLEDPDAVADFVQLLRQEPM